MRITVMLAALVAALPASAADPAPAFPLKDGDVWVMAGDSITAQHLHSNYFEAFCYARYPNLKFAFRNSGVGGHTIPTTLARFEYDIAAWKPTVVSVELGMNDAGNTQTERFVTNMGTMVGRIRGVGARPVILSASPVNDGSTTGKFTNRNQRLSEYATALKEFSEKEKLPYADQFHALVDVWGRNKPREALANTLATTRAVAADDAVVGVEHLRAFLAAQDKSPSRPVTMMGDPVHPGAPGQLMMAAALLAALGADGFVSSATLDAGGAVAEAKGCKVTGATATGGGVAFDRLDDTLPFPIPDEARAVLPLAPGVLALSRYTLAVSGLKDGEYEVTADGVACGRASAKELAAGVNLTTLGGLDAAKSPVAVRTKGVLAAVAAKEGGVDTWRRLSQRAHAAGAAPGLKDELAALTAKVEEADAKIREAAKPRSVRWTVAPVAAK